MTLWTWVLIVWAVAASATVLWLAVKLSAKVELLAELSNGPDDLWGHGLPDGGSLDSAKSRVRSWRLFRAGSSLRVADGS